MYKQAFLILDRDEGGQTCSWRFWGYDWEKERSCRNVHQLQWDPDGFCGLPSCRLVLIFRFMLLSISFVSTEIHTNTLLQCSKYQSIIPSAIQLQTMKI